MINNELTPATGGRVERGLPLRIGEALLDAAGQVPLQIDNEDEAKYADKSGTYTKGILPDKAGLVNQGIRRLRRHPARVTAARS